MKKELVVLFITLGFVFTSCEDLIQVDVPEGETKLVVEALFYSDDSTHLVTLSKTAPYFDKNQTPRVTGATVYALASNGDSIRFIENSFGTGDYNADFVIEEGIDYILNIIDVSGRIYQSTPERLLRVPPIEVYQSDKIFDSIGDFRDAGYYVTFRTQEPAGQGDFYRWIIYINGEKQISPEFLWVEDDLLVDGNVIEDLPQFFIYGMLPNDSVQIWQTAISKEAHFYWILVQEQLFNQGSPFDTPPSSIRSNVKSLSNPDEIVLSIFSIGNVEKDHTIVIPK